MKASTPTQLLYGSAKLHGIERSQRLLVSAQDIPTDRCKRSDASINPDTAVVWERETAEHGAISDLKGHPHANPDECCPGGRGKGEGKLVSHAWFPQGGRRISDPGRCVLFMEYVDLTQPKLPEGRCHNACRTL